jgi:hypothetical protein
MEMFPVVCTAYCVCVRMQTSRFLIFLLHGSHPPHLNSRIPNHPVALVKAKSDVSYAASLLATGGISRRVGGIVLEDY